MYIRSIIFICGLFFCLEGALSTPGKEKDEEPESENIPSSRFSINVLDPDVFYKEEEVSSPSLELFCCSPETEKNAESPFFEIESPDFGETLITFLNFYEEEDYFCREFSLTQDILESKQGFFTEISERPGVYYLSIRARFPVFLPQILSSLEDIHVAGISFSFFDFSVGASDSFQIILPPERLLEFKLQFSFESWNTGKFLDTVAPLITLHVLDLSFCSLSNPFLKTLRNLEFKNLEKLILQGNPAIGTRYLVAKDPYKEEEEGQSSRVIDFHSSEPHPNPYPLVHILCAPWFEALQELHLDSCSLWPMHVDTLRASFKVSQLQFLSLGNNQRIDYNSDLTSREFWSPIFPKIQEIKL